MISILGTAKPIKSLPPSFFLIAEEKLHAS
jgi:hypothetical protein